MFEIRVNKNIVSVQETEPLISGSASVYKCRFSFDASWDGFFRSAVFRVGSMVKTIPLDGTDTCELPWELLDKKHIGLPVEVSVYGVKGETEILPTTWDKLGRVRRGSEPGEDAKEFSPSVYDRIVSLVKLYSDKSKGDKGDKGDPGEGDMTAAVYDPQGRKTDIYQYADDVLSAVPEWAMQPEKPAYTASEVGAAPAPLSAHKTLYVATTGNDATGDGTQSNPYATIQRALNTLPKDLGDYKVTINVAAGEYAGFEVKSFSGGYSNNPGITIKGESRDTVTIAGNADVNSCSSMVELANLHFTGWVRSLANRYWRIFGCLIDGTAAADGIWVCVTNTAVIFNTIINDKTNYAILVDGSTAFVSYVSGANNTKGLQSGSSSSALPGLAVVGNFTLSADTQYVKDKGGVIIVGNAFV